MAQAEKDPSLPVQLSRRRLAQGRPGARDPRAAVAALFEIRRLRPPPRVLAGLLRRRDGSADERRPGRWRRELRIGLRVRGGRSALDASSVGLEDDRGSRAGGRTARAPDREGTWPRRRPRGSTRPRRTLA